MYPPHVLEALTTVPPGLASNPRYFSGVAMGSQNRCVPLAAKLSSPLQVDQHHGAGREEEAVPSPHVSGHFCCVDDFTCEEFESVVAATHICGDDHGYRIDANRMRLRAITLLLRWSSLRIRDAVTLERSVGI